MPAVELKPCPVGVVCNYSKRTTTRPSRRSSRRWTQGSLRRITSPRPSSPRRLRSPATITRQSPTRRTSDATWLLAGSPHPNPLRTRISADDVSFVQAQQRAVVREGADKPAQSHLANYAVAVRRYLAYFATCSLLAVAGAACTGSNNPGGHRREHTGDASVIGRPQAANLAMSGGRSSARYVITAPDPARYAFDVSVSAPSSIDVAVSIDTWYGAEFPSILVSSHQLGACRLRGSEDVCFERFPWLPAQRAGAWTVVAAKKSGPAATVRIVITFA